MIKQICGLYDDLSFSRQPYGETNPIRRRAECDLLTDADVGRRQRRLPGVGRAFAVVAQRSNLTPKTNPPTGYGPKQGVCPAVAAACLPGGVSPLARRRIDEAPAR